MKNAKATSLQNVANTLEHTRKKGLNGVICLSRYLLLALEMMCICMCIYIYIIYIYHMIYIYMIYIYDIWYIYMSKLYAVLTLRQNSGLWRLQYKILRPRQQYCNPSRISSCILSIRRCHAYLKTGSCSVTCWTLAHAARNMWSCQRTSDI